MNLSALFRAAMPESVGLNLGADPEALRIGISGSEPVVHVRHDGRDWLVETAEAHGHFDEADDAVALAVQLLRGDARTVEEYRGDTLASTWIEVRDEEGWYAGHFAEFLCPFDEDEVELWPGETWRQVRVTRRYLAEEGRIEETSIERPTDERGGAPNLMRALRDGIGAPLDGMRWTLGADNTFIYQAPRGWRRHVVRKENAQFTQFRPRQAGLVFRERHFYRDSGAGPAVTHAMGPRSIQESMGSDDPKWVQHTWTLLFTNGEFDMMAILDLFHLPNLSAEASLYRELIAIAAPTSLMVPNEWDMQRGP